MSPRRVMMGYCQHYYAVKCAAMQSFVLHLVYVVLVRDSFATRTYVFFLRPLGAET